MRETRGARGGGATGRRGGGRASGRTRRRGGRSRSRRLSRSKRSSGPRICAMEIDGSAEMGAGTAAARPDARREVARGDGEQGERTRRVPVSVEEQRRCFCRLGHTPLHTQSNPESVSGSGISSAVPLQHLAVLHCRSTRHPQRGERRGAGSWRRAHSCWSSATSRSRLPAAWCRWICAQITLARVPQPVGMRLVLQ